MDGNRKFILLQALQARGRIIKLTAVLPPQLSHGSGNISGNSSVGRQLVASFDRLTQRGRHGKGVSVASHANFRIARVGVPVQVCGMVVNPGDVIHGDWNGVISVPPVDIAALQEAVETVRRKEKTVMDFVRGPEFTLAGFQKLVVE